MNGKAAFWVAVGAALIAAIIASSFLRNPSMTTGRPAPEITGEDVDGKPMKLSDFRGTVVFLDFWGNW